MADIDTALADPANPRALRPAYDSGDGLHPNNAGYRRIADTIPSQNCDHHRPYRRPVG